MLGLSLRPDCTQAVRGRLKNKRVDVDQFAEFPEMVSLLQQRDINGLVQIMVQIKPMLKQSDEEVFIALASELVEIECADRDVVAEEMWDLSIPPWMAQVMQLAKKEADYYLEIPTQLVERNQMSLTGMAVPKAYVDDLLAAAHLAGLNIMAIEPAAFSVLRFLNNWDCEHCVAEFGETSSYLVGFSPIKGLFRLSIPSVGWPDLIHPEHGLNCLKQQLALYDISAVNVFDLVNTNVPIVVVSPEQQGIQQVFAQGGLDLRLERVVLPPQIVCKESIQLINRFVVPLGLVLRPLHERMVGREDPERELYSDADPAAKAI